MAITKHVIAELRVFKLMLCRIQANITTKGLKLAEFGGYMMIPWRILANLGTRRFKLLSPSLSPSIKKLVW